MDLFAIIGNDLADYAAKASRLNDHPECSTRCSATSKYRKQAEHFGKCLVDQHFATVKAQDTKKTLKKLMRWTQLHNSTNTFEARLIFSQGGQRRDVRRQPNLHNHQVMC